MVSPLNKLLTKDVEYKWTDTEETAFNNLREGLKNAPFLNYPSPTDRYVLTTDASTKETGYILNQITSEGEEKIIAVEGEHCQNASKITQLLNLNFYL